MFDFAPGKHLYLRKSSKPTTCRPAKPADIRHVVFFEFFINVFLEVQNEKYSSILYLIDCIAYGLDLWYGISATVPQPRCGVPPGALLSKGGLVDSS